MSDNNVVAISGMTFAEKVLIALDKNHGVNEDSVAESLATAIRGETVKKSFDVQYNDITGETRTVLTNVQVTTKPRDVLAGSMIYDSLTGGRLGITAKVVKQVSATRELYEQYRPVLPDGASLEDVVAREGEVIDVSVHEMLHEEE